jgi:hypothetical protein
LAKHLSAESEEGIISMLHDGNNRTTGSSDVLDNSKHGGTVFNHQAVVKHNKAVVNQSVAVSNHEADVKQNKTVENQSETRPYPLSALVNPYKKVFGSQLRKSMGPSIQESCKDGSQQNYSKHVPTAVPYTQPSSSDEDNIEEHYSTVIPSTVAGYHDISDDEIDNNHHSIFPTKTKTAASKTTSAYDEDPTLENEKKPAAKTTNLSMQLSDSLSTKESTPSSEYIAMYNCSTGQPSAFPSRNNKEILSTKPSPKVATQFKPAFCDSNPYKKPKITNHNHVMVKDINMDSEMIRNWHLNSVVLEKSELTTYQDKHGRKKSRFSVVLFDQSGVDIKATFFNAKQLHSRLVENQVFSFSNGKIQRANPDFNNCISPYEILFFAGSEVKKLPNINGVHIVGIGEETKSTNTMIHRKTLLEQLDVNFLGDTPAITPICNLSNSTPDGWLLIAHVTKKSLLRDWSKNGKEGSVFTIELLDSSANDISGSFFNEAAKEYYSLLEIGKTYIITRGVLKEANKEFKTCVSNYELRFARNSIFHPVPEDHPCVSKFSHKFVPLNQLENIHISLKIEIMAIVTEIGEAWLDKSGDGGGPLMKCVLTIIDDTDQSGVSILLIGDNAVDAKRCFKHQPVVAFTPCQVISNGTDTSLISTGMVTLFPKNKEACKLENWWLFNKI